MPADLCRPAVQGKSTDVGNPSKLKVEAKTTSAAAVPVSVRELRALRAADIAETGILAVLFRSPGRAGSQWILVDVQEFVDDTNTVRTFEREHLLRIAQRQPWLDDLRGHVAREWPRFLVAFEEWARQGHIPLFREIERLHRAGRLPEFLPADPVLEFDRARTLDSIMDSLGDKEAGRVLQDLLAYTMATAGYRQITNNPTGVPDFVLENPVGGEGERCVLELSRADALRLAEWSERAGDAGLAQSIRDQLI
jgi:hypothetical protein